MPCGVLLATRQMSSSSACALLVRQVLHLAPIATFHMSPRRGVTANIHLAFGKCTFALLVSIAMVPLLHVACLVTMTLAHFASLATQHQPKNKPNSNIVAKLAIHLSSAPIAVHQISHLRSLLVPFVRTRLPCGVRLATLQTSSRSAYAHLVRQLLYLAPIATLHMSPWHGVTANTGLEWLDLYIFLA